MPDIHFSLPIQRDRETVYDTLVTADGLNEWWTQDANGAPRLGAQYQFGFGPDQTWHGTVTVCEPGRAFEWTMEHTDVDWDGTRVGFRLKTGVTGTVVDFYHCDWPRINDHFRGSAYCWAMYLRVLRRFLEQGERVPYAQRDDA